MILLGVAAAGFVAVRSDVRPLSSAALPGEPLPAVTAPSTTSAPAPAVSTPASTRPATGAPGRTSAANSLAPALSLPTLSPPTPVTTTPAEPVPPPDDQPLPPPDKRLKPQPDNGLAPPPSDDRVGVIRGQDGLCLDLDGGIAVDGNHVQVFDCNGTAGQVWTLAADGTMRVSGKCALLAGDNTVDIAGCDGQRTAQWQVFGQLLINAAGGGCLTDPSAGRTAGTAVTVTPCGGSASQRWSLP